MTYKGKVDWWMRLWFLAGIVWSVVVEIWRHDYEPLAFFGGMVLILLICAWPQEYLTADDALYIRSGFTKRVIPWREITSISVSDGSGSYPWTGFVLSRDRLLIRYADRKFMIAPDDRVSFFDDVAAHCPQLSRRGMEFESPKAGQIR